MAYIYLIITLESRTVKGRRVKGSTVTRTGGVENESDIRQLLRLCSHTYILETTYYVV